MAIGGLGRVRDNLHEFLETISVMITANDVSVSRADYAIDLLMPEFELVPGNFILHSKPDRASFEEMAVHGVSGRVTSVRIGCMPGRQVAVYDKRADIIRKRKPEWWEIYNANLARDGRPQEPLPRDRRPARGRAFYH